MQGDWGSPGPSHPLPGVTQPPETASSYPCRSGYHLGVTWPPGDTPQALEASLWPPLLLVDSGWRCCSAPPGPVQPPPGIVCPMPVVLRRGDTAREGVHQLCRWDPGRAPPCRHSEMTFRQQKGETVLLGGRPKGIGRDIGHAAAWGGLTCPWPWREHR